MVASDLDSRCTRGFTRRRGPPAASALTIPLAAVTRIDGKPMVFVMVGKGTVEPRQVKLGAEDANNVAIADGLKDGEAVVLGGMFALKSEIFR